MKRHPFSQIHRAEQTNFEASGDCNDAAEPDRVHHALIENRGQNPAVGDAIPALESIGQGQLGPAVLAAHVEVELQAVLAYRKAVVDFERVQRRGYIIAGTTNAPRTKFMAIDSFSCP